MNGHWFVALVTDVSQMFSEACVQSTAGFSDVDFGTKCAVYRIHKVGGVTVEASSDPMCGSWGLKSCAVIQVGAGVTDGFGACMRAWRIDVARSE